MYYFVLTSSFILQWASWIAVLWLSAKVFTSKKSIVKKLLYWVGYFLLFLVLNLVGQLSVAWLNIRSPIFYEYVEASFGGITATATKNDVMQEYLIQIAGLTLYNAVVWQLIMTAIALLYTLYKFYRSKKTS